MVCSVNICILSINRNLTVNCIKCANNKGFNETTLYNIIIIIIILHNNSKCRTI